MDESPSPVTVSEGEVVNFHYIKGNFYRALHVDGAYGGLTARGVIAVTVYNERQPIPQQTGNSVVKTAGDRVELGEEALEARVGKEGIVRELDATMYLSVKVAEDVAHWLLERVSEHKTIRDEIKKMQAAGDQPSA